MFYFVELTYCIGIPDFFIGTQVYINPCNNFPCNNGGTCTCVANNRYVCTCRDGYGGVNCDSLIGKPNTNVSYMYPVLCMFLCFVYKACLAVKQPHLENILGCKWCVISTANCCNCYFTIKKALIIR